MGKLSKIRSTSAGNRFNISLLGNKYLLFGNGTDTKHINSSVKYFKRCADVKTKKQFSCKMIAQNQEGLELVGLYQQLFGEGNDSSNKIHEVILNSTSFFLIMPASYGNVLDYAREKKQLNEPEAARIFQQMVTAVEFCHSKGIVLRDLKMQNFVFRDEARTIVRLGTLEGSVLLHDINDDKQSDRHGCPNYVSPEKAATLGNNRKYPGRASDVWALGIILYSLLVNQYPFSDVENSKLFKKIRRGSFSIPENISNSAKILIRRLLQKDPRSRPSCREILQDSWIQKGFPENSSARDYSHYNTLPSFRVTNNDRVPSNGSSLSGMNQPSMNQEGVHSTLLTRNISPLAIDETTISELQLTNMDISEDQCVPNM